jgi:hypothetical protein
MPRVFAKSDTLNELNKNYQQTPLQKPVFLNSVPKCGTHLVRNIFRMFVPVEQQYHDMFIQIPVLNQHLNAFSVNTPKLSWGHLLFSDDSAIATKTAKQVLVVRDPYDWVLARARFFLSDTFQGSLEHLKEGNVSVEQVLSMMIFGIYQKAPTLQEIFTHNAVSWLGSDIRMIKYEDVLQHVQNPDRGAARDYFEDLFSYCEMPMPEDWKERVKVGSDRKQSGTARENLSGKKFDIPKELPEQQKQMLDYAVPGLRKLLQYE